MEKLFLTPKEFASKSGLKACHVRHLCKTNQLENIKTAGGGYYKILSRELNKFIDTRKEQSSKEDYEKLLRENEHLKTLINNITAMLRNITEI